MYVQHKLVGIAVFLGSASVSQDLKGTTAMMVSDCTIIWKLLECSIKSVSIAKYSYVLEHYSDELH